MPEVKITITIRLKWWFVYLYLPALMCALNIARQFDFDFEPNTERLDYWLQKAVTLEV